MTSPPPTTPLTVVEGPTYRVTVTDPSSPYRIRGKVLPRVFVGVYRGVDCLGLHFEGQHGESHTAHLDHITSLEVI